MITCPFCSKSIDSDSCYCDQCGKILLICLDCGAFVRNKYCGKCRSKQHISVKEQRQQNQTGLIQTTDKIPQKQAANEVSEKSVKNREADSNMPSKPQGLQFLNKDESIRLLFNPEQKCWLLGRTEGDFTESLKQDSFVSRRHALVEYNASDKGWYITDLQSTNGILINNKMLLPDKPYPFKTGDQIQIGSNQFLISTYVY